MYKGKILLLSDFSSFSFYCKPYRFFFSSLNFFFFLPLVHLLALLLISLVPIFWLLKAIFSWLGWKIMFCFIVITSNFESSGQKWSSKHQMVIQPLTPQKIDSTNTCALNGTHRSTLETLKSNNHELQDTTTQIHKNEKMKKNLVSACANKVRKRVSVESWKKKKKIWNGKREEIWVYGKMREKRISEIRNVKESWKLERKRWR